MNSPHHDIKSSEDARREADYHRYEMAETLDKLGNKLSQAVQKTEHQINRPRNWIRAYPYIAFALSVGIGYAVAQSGKKTMHRKETQFTHELQRAYEYGRQDEYLHRPVTQQDDWHSQAQKLQTPVTRPSLTMHHLIVDLILPVARHFTAGLVTRLGARWGGRDGV